MDKERCEQALQNFKKAYYTNNTEQEYLFFSQFIQGLFISKKGWIVDTGNFQNVNRELIEDVYEKIQKHPLLWKLFFMIA